MMNRRNMLATTAAGMAAVVLPAGPARAQSMPTVEEVLFDPDIPVLGNPDGDVTIAEFFDYQCPYCKRGHPGMMDVVESDGNIRLVMKDWPILGDASLYASRLVLAARGKATYAKALDALMATEGRLKTSQVDEILIGAGFDPAALSAGYKRDSERIDGIIARNMNQADAFGFGGTPSFVIGTTIFHGFMDEEALAAAVAQARAQ